MSNRIGAVLLGSLLVCGFATASSAWTPEDRAACMRHCTDKLNNTECYYWLKALDPSYDDPMEENHWKLCYESSQIKNACVAKCNTGNQAQCPGNTFCTGGRFPTNPIKF